MGLAALWLLRAHTNAAAQNLVVLGYHAFVSLQRPFVLIVIRREDVEYLPVLCLRHAAFLASVGRVSTLKRRVSQCPSEPREADPRLGSVPVYRDAAGTKGGEPAMAEQPLRRTNPIK